MLITRGIATGLDLDCGLYIAQPEECPKVIALFERMGKEYTLTKADGYKGFVYIFEWERER